MPKREDVEKQLDGIQNWIMVSNKKNIVRGLQDLLNSGETLQDLIDGLYRGTKISEGGKELAGILCLTDQRIIFITSESKKPLYEEIPFSDITHISYEKAFSSIILTIKLKSQGITFKTFDNRALVKRFVDAVSERSSGASVSHEDNSLKILDEINDTLKSLTEMNKDISASSHEEIFKETEPVEKSMDLKDVNFLFTEAKKISGIISEYLDFNGDGKLGKALVNDVIILSSLCSFADSTLGLEELLFISMVMMPLNPGKSKKIEELSKKVYSNDKFPVEYKDQIIEYWDTISEYIKKTQPTADLEGFSLKSLNLLQQFDRDNGTAHTDRVGTAYDTFCQCLMKADGTLREDEEERLKQIHALISRGMGIASSSVMVQEHPEDETLDQVMEKINGLVGMKKVKDDINTLINLIKVQKEREARGLPATNLSLHAVFYGPPGTGKTTIARLLGKVYRCLGLLKKGQLVETDRAGLVAGYVGQTAINVDKVVQKALDGVLFIDEAYALIPEHGGNDFGKEAVDTILKRMEDYRDRLVVIVAGYPDEMKHFIFSNPGLKSRFSRYFYFDHFEPGELIEIFDIFCKNVEFKVDKKAREKVYALMEKYFKERDKTFGNGRMVRNVFERVIERQANRIAGIAPLTDDILCTVTADDIPDEKDLSDTPVMKS